MGPENGAKRGKRRLFMKKGLIIVESPTKVRTLKRFLGRDYEIKASVGHIKDLPKKRLGVDVENGFAPEYEVIRGKGKVVKELRAAASKVDHVFLAPDPDREGEAIAWHIAEELKKGKRGKAVSFHRVLFHELTKGAVAQALANPVELDRNKFESQQARRILDRLVGYELSPLLWEKVKQGLSAGRVQSVALRLICDREKEIRAFVPREYWTVDAVLCGGDGGCLTARVIEREGEKLELANGAEAREVEAALKAADFLVSKTVSKEQRRHPPPPFITSTLQQEASRRLRFSAKKTMMVAQRLYEGVEIGSEGPVGLITYMRTDSTRVAAESVEEARAHVARQFGPDFVPSKPRHYRKGKGAQDAHEAIRPTSVERTPESVAAYLDKDSLALYTLIWKRFVASQMASAVYELTTVEVQAGPYLLRASGSVMRFPGFTVLYSEGDGTKEGEEPLLPPLKQGDPLSLEEVKAVQHFTQPPPRYTEASLIKALEEKGIGRPSTYATILSTIRNKDYVRMEKRRFHPTELGMLITDLLVQHFPEILDVQFTANMEQKLDEIEGGKREWRSVLSEFYTPFRERLSKARQEMRLIKASGVPTDLECEKCGAPLVIRYGRSGEFLGCSRYPECDFTSDFERDAQGGIVVARRQPEETGEICEKCGRPMLVKRGRYGEFLACSGYPECKNARPISTGVACPKEGCDGTLVKRFTRRGKPFYGCSNYPRCDYAVWDEPVAKECPSCAFPILVKRVSGGKTQMACPKKGCRFRGMEAAEE